ncbi:MAG TPA: M14 family zinc carboxypeptidase [Thermoanaerobaculia bacterium]|nr:M14 family zinc carboxypeptidase [Thermoanaerobaculia bacterium]
MTLRFPAVAVLLLLSAAALFAQDAVPTPEEFLGYKPGERFTSWDRIVDYFESLPRTSNLITVEKFGESYEGRPLILAAITSPKNRAALEAIRQNVVALGEADTTTEARAAEIARSTPAIVWLAFGVHGNESSSAEAAMQVASTLLHDPESQQILDNCVVLIDPLQNPDGRERYIQWFHRMRGARPDPNPDAFEHSEPWPGGRFNHYLIDMNRDWAWTSQREVQARVAKYRQWNPQVYVDFHEMGWQSSYFFPPDATPINMNLPKDVEKWLEVFGRANADAFSKKGWPFFVAERFDLFYPGYGDSWPALHGAIGMTYEVAGHGRAGTAIRREDGTTLTLSDRIARHYTTGMTTLRTAAAHREDLLKYSYRAARGQLDAGKNTFLILPGSPNFDALIDVLRRQAIRIGVLAAPATLRATRVDGDTADNHTFPAGTAIITTHQPLGGLVQTLIERSPAFTKGFLEEQREKTQADESDDFYDLTSWSLPLAMNVEAWVTAAPITSDVRPYQRSASAAFRTASYGYLVDGLDPNIYRLAGAMLAEEVRFSVAESDIVVGERTFARGTLIIFKGSNRADLDPLLERLGRETGVTPFPLATGWSGGTALGSEKIHYVQNPKIGLVGGPGTASTSYGMLWHTLDIDTPIPHSNLSFDALRNLDLSHYKVLVFPDGEGYAEKLGKRGVEKLQAWLRGGGTLVAVKGASAFLREKDVDISKIKPWAPPKKKDKDDEAPATDEHYNEPRIPGATLRTAMNERSYLTFGVPRAPMALIEGSLVLKPVSHKVDNIVTIDSKNPLVAGVAWPESLDRIKGAAYLVNEPYGKGTVITFADDPHFRLFWRGTLPLFLNAVLYSPSFPRE